MDVTNPYKFIGIGAMDVTKPYEFIRIGPTFGAQTQELRFEESGFYCSVNSFRFLGFLLWFVLGPGGLRETPGGPGKAHG